MRSVMEHSFSEVPSANIPRSTFNRSHGLKTTFDADWLVPILVDDVVPGDSYNVNMSHFCRLGSPMLHPIMDNMYLETFFFFVPYRLIWDDFEKMHGAQDNPGDSIDFTVPSLGNQTAADFTQPGSYYALCDYMGLPHKTNVDTTKISTLPFRAYHLIWNEWFRDQNLQDSVPVPKNSGNDFGVSTFAMQKRGKRHDYFTSCLPWPQKGEAVSLPLGERATVFVDNVAGSTLNVTAEVTGGLSPTTLDASATTLRVGSQDTDGRPMFADLSSATAATVNDLRLAFQTQRLLERDARSGTRYTESILAHFGVTVPDFRLQRPEFLGGGTSPIHAEAVPNTSNTTEAEQATLAAHGVTAGNHGFTKSFVEHGVIIGLANVRGDITYSQGAERYWFKKTRYDFYYPVLSQIGEQAVLNQEIFWSGNTFDDDVFGYQERYAEYRYKPSRITGKFRPDNATSLESWILTEKFATLPALGDSFIKANLAPQLDRALAVPSEPQIIGDFFFDMQCARPMPLYGVPGNLDHF